MPAADGVAHFEMWFDGMLVRVFSVGMRLGAPGDRAGQIVRGERDDKRTGALTIEYFKWNCSRWQCNPIGYIASGI